MRTGTGTGLSRPSYPVLFGGSHLPETIAWNTAIVGAGGTTQPEEVVTAVDALITDLKIAGVWDKIDALHIPALGVWSLLTNLRNPSIVGVPYNNPTYTDYVGTAGGNTKYIDLGINPKTTTHYTGGDGTMGLSITSAPTPANMHPLGCRTSTTDNVNRIAFYSNSGNKLIYPSMYVDSALEPNTLIDTPFSGGNILASVNSSGNVMSIDGVSVFSDANSANYNANNAPGISPENDGLNMYFLAVNTAGTAGVFALDGAFAYVIVGGYLTHGVASETLAYNTAIETYKSTVGAL